MACNTDHSKLAGVKFCTECGDLIQELKKFCSQGHEILPKKKFCEVCGESVSLAASSSTPAIYALSNPSPAPLVNSQFRALDPITFNDSPFAAVEKKKPPLIPIIGGAVTFVMLFVGVVIYNATKVSHTSVEASMTLVGTECYDISWGFYDIPGGQVVLRVDGVPVAYASYPSLGDDNSFLGCRFSTTFYEVPMNGTNYSFGLASGRRGTIDNSREEMVSNDWSFSATLG